MPSYLWTARRWNSENLSQGQIQAESLALARGELLRQSYEIVQIQLSPEPGLEGAQKLLELRHPEKVRPDVFRAAGSQRNALTPKTPLWQAASHKMRRYLTRQKWGHRERAVFFRQLALMLGAGVRLHRAFQVLAETQPDPSVRQRLLAVPNQACFDEGLRQSGLLNPFELAQVEAALENSTLVNTFHRLANQVEYWHRLRQNLWLQLSTPVTALVFCWIMVPLLGRLIGILLGSLAELHSSPFSLRLSAFLQSGWWLPLAWGIPLLVLMLLKQAAEQWLKPQLVLKLPWLGRWYRAFDLSLSLKIFADLYESGIRLDRALELTQRNSILGCWSRMQKGLAEGQSLSQALDQPGEEVLRQTLKAGEESGKLDLLCQKMQRFYEEEVQTSLRGLMALLEPTLTMAVSLLVGGMCWLCLSPILKIAQSL